MAELNRVFLIGNLTRDPEVRYIPSGRAVADLRLASTRHYTTGSGENREDTCFVNVVVWGRQAETCGEYLSKGSPVMVQGSLRYEQWEKEGQKFSRLFIQADRVQFLGRPKKAEFADAPPPPPAETGGAAERGEPPAAAGGFPPEADARPPEADDRPPDDAAGARSGDDDDLPF
ncbi:MAG: single-stranded DNA-binding protein [Kiritimatiellae bacterium]|nr:single-stranded DNA-binding protein [Kiritimatiellia bacterium]